jgi:uncharacterized membrane protein YqiK
MATNLPKIDETALAKKHEGVIDSAKETAVTTPEQYKSAVGFLGVIKEFEKEIIAETQPTIDKIKSAKAEIEKARKEAVDLQRRHLGPLQEAEKIIKGKIAHFKTLEEVKLRKERERKEAEARKKAEEERALAEFEAECDGDDEELEVLQSTPVEPEPVEVSKGTQAKGAEVRKVWDYEIEDIEKLPRGYMIPDHKKIKHDLSAFKGDTKIPGVRVFQKPVVAAVNR